MGNCSAVGPHLARPFTGARAPSGNGLARPPGPPTLARDRTVDRIAAWDNTRKLMSRIAHDAAVQRHHVGFQAFQGLHEAAAAESRNPADACLLVARA
jgi:hypothetical protein